MILPNGRADTIRFFELHLPKWALDPAALGLTQQEIEELEQLAAEARAAQAAAEEARLAARAATIGLHNKADALRRKGKLAIDRIKATADADPHSTLRVFAAAELDPPRAPQRRGAPGKPTHLRTSIDETGVLTLTWKSTNSKPSTGAMFTISRQVTLAGATRPTAFEVLGAVPARTFTDTSLPSGATVITYQVQGRRGPRVGEAAMFTVRLSGPQSAGISPRIAA